MTKKMTVRDLIAKLEEFDGDAEVHFAYNYGDHWRTTVAPHVTEVEEAEVAWSEYHGLPKIAETDSDDDGPAKDYNPVVVIR